MKILRFILFALTIFSIFATSLNADDEPQPLENAALLYWPAFDQMPEFSIVENDILVGLRKAKSDEVVRMMIERSEAALKLMYRGANIRTCRWQSEIKKDQGTILSYTLYSRQLARLALFRARYRFENGQPTEGWRDIRAALVLARHAGSEGLFLTILGQFAIERDAIEAVSPYLSDLPSDVLEQAIEDLKHLPDRARVRDGIALEKKWELKWLREFSTKKVKNKDELLMLARMIAQIIDDPDLQYAFKIGANPEMLKTLLDDAESVYDQFQQIAKLPTAKQDAALEEFKKTIEETGNSWAQSAVSEFNKMIRAQRAYDVRRSMLAAAIDVALHGPEQLAAHPDPTTGRPFRYKEMPGGFKLSSPYTFAERRVTLRVGRTDRATASPIPNGLGSTER